MRYMVIVNVDKVINCNLFWPLKCFAMQMQQSRAGQRGEGVLYRVGSTSQLLWGIKNE